PLRAFERARRTAVDFARAPPSDHAFGPDPYAVARAPGGGFVGLLRGRDALVLLDDQLAEIARIPAPGGASGLTIDGDVALVVGQGSPAVARARVARGRLVPLDPVGLGASDPPPDGLRAVAAGEGGAVYALDETNDRLLYRLGRAEGFATGSVELCRAPFRLARAGDALVAACLVDHAIVAVPLDARGAPDVARAVRAAHDGPFWGFDAREQGGALVVLAGGVEDHPLDRTHGSFGFVDSFVYELRLAPGARAFDEVRALDVSDLGVVVPKAIAMTDDGREALVTGYGSDRALVVPLDGGAPRPVPSVPGVAALVASQGGFVAADPLLDVWARLDGAAVRTAAVPDAGAPPRDAAARVGEALVFTTLIAPWNRSDGELSRFTCETCHFEGAVDGRTHRTGRGDVVATTKPLLGLFNNRPHFSRALDPDLSSVAENEFRVAGARSGHDPHFSIGPAEAPWLAALGVDRALDATALRRDFMTFFMAFTPRANPHARGRSHFDALEREGAEVFRDDCERCHEARDAADLPASRASFAAWEARIFAPEGPLVWASDRYEKTGVEPYVNEKGARVTSLRRVASKRPYFTTGVAKSLDDVLDLARFDGPRFWHAEAPPAARALTPDEKRALRAFLLLL
ncbi:MAG TPA: hypothetical protein VHB21_00065, partial [Minicystis sp.]|nr:hypothetical protein [Minicystis sp.]